MKPVLSSSTEANLKLYLKSPSHGLLITGPEGAGKSFISSFIASKLLNKDYEKLNSSPEFIVIEPIDGRQISIGQIRELKHSAKLVATGNEQIKRVVIIDKADTMTLEAQNALLKTLEEPSKSTLIILTANDNSGLLDTIKSRLQTIDINPVSIKTAQAYFESSNKTELEKAWRLSGGYAGLMSQLLNEDSHHGLLKGVDDAKELIKMSTYQRILTINAYASEKAKLEDMLSGLDRVLGASQSNAIDKNDKRQNLRILKARRALNEAIRNQKYNVNTKLNLLELFTALG